MLPEGFNETKVWGFAGLCKDEKNKKIKYVKHSPGPTFEVDRNINTNVQWNNKILGEYMFKIDKTLVWSNPNNIVYNNNLDNDSKEGQWPPTLIIHIHGISTPPIYDGNPRAWYTATGIKGQFILLTIINIQMSKEELCFATMSKVQGCPDILFIQGCVGYIL